MRFLRNPAAVLDRIVHARGSLPALFGFAYLEAALLPVPIEAVIAPYMQMRRDILWVIAGVALAGYVAAALTGYGIGALAFEGVGVSLISAFGLQSRIAGAEAFVTAWGFWAMILMALTPLPTQIVMIVAGALGLPLPSFLSAILLARGARTFGVALLVFLYGDRVVHWFATRRTRNVRRPGASGPWWAP
jgi:membrane protein YqaA with SNARE-associated domain